MIDTAAGPAEISGRIDRLSVLADRVLIVDFKTGRAPKAGAEGLAPTHLRQMALYRA